MACNEQETLPERMTPKAKGPFDKGHTSTHNAKAFKFQLFMISMSTICTTVALVGFQPARRRNVEQAGIAFECNFILDQLALGRSPSSALRISQQPTSSNGSSAEDVNEALDEDLIDRDEDKYHRYVSKLEPNDWKGQYRCC